MTTPTLTSFAAPQGGAQRPSGGRASAEMKPRLLPAHYTPGRQAGSYLLEALIAILIFSFGVLGLIGLLGSSIRITNDARFRSEAANLASAMIADMWTMTATQMDTEFGSSGGKLKDWQDKAKALLPTATATVDLKEKDLKKGLSPESRSVVVTVSWQMPGETEKHQHLMAAEIGKNRIGP